MSLHIRTWAGRKYLANWDVTQLDTSNSNGWAATPVRLCRALVEAEGSALNRQWFEFVLTVYNKQSPATWRRWHSDKKFWSGQCLATEYTCRYREAEGDIQQLTPAPESNTQGLGEHMCYCDEITHRCPQICVSTNSKVQFSERHEKQYHAQVFEGELAEKRGCRGWD